jgi:hypothetical protein
VARNSKVNSHPVVSRSCAYQLQKFVSAGNRRYGNADNFRKSHIGDDKTSSVCGNLHVVMAWRGQHRLSQIPASRTQRENGTAPDTTCSTGHAYIRNCHDFWLFLVGGQENEACHHGNVQHGETANWRIDWFRSQGRGDLFSGSGHCIALFQPENWTRQAGQFSHRSLLIRLKISNLTFNNTLFDPEH